MMYHSIAKITLGALLVTLAGCSSPVESLASLHSEPSTPQSPAPTPAVAAIYLRESPSFFRGGQFYILYVDSTFDLQYGGCCDFPGTYSRADSAITFNFEGAGWVATGIVAGDSLVVKYNDVMLGADFEDGVYIR